jgi:hypothetical protein
VLVDVETLRVWSVGEIWTDFILPRRAWVRKEEKGIDREEGRKWKASSKEALIAISTAQPARTCLDFIGLAFGNGARSPPTVVELLRVVGRGKRREGGFESRKWERACFGCRMAEGGISMWKPWHKCS